MTVYCEYGCKFLNTTLMFLTLMDALYTPSLPHASKLSAMYDTWYVLILQKSNVDCCHETLIWEDESSPGRNWRFSTLFGTRGTIKNRVRKLSMLEWLNAGVEWLNAGVIQCKLRYLMPFYRIPADLHVTALIRHLVWILPKSPVFFFSQTLWKHWVNSASYIGRCKGKQINSINK